MKMAQRKKRNSYILSLLFLSCISYLHASENIDRQVVLNYLQNTKQLLQLERLVEARSLLRIAEEFTPEIFSDYWYYRAMLLADDLKKTKLYSLEQAIKVDNWAYEKPEETAKELVHFLYNWERYADVVKYYMVWPQNIRNYDNIAYLAAFSMYKTGEQEAAYNLAEERLFEHPEQIEFFRILFHKKPVDDLLVRFSLYVENYPPSVPTVFRILINDSIDQKIKDFLLNIYVKTFGDDYFTTANKLIASRSNKKTRFQILTNNYDFRDFNVMREVFYSVDSVVPLEENIAQLDGVYFIDRDYDGVNEEELSFKNGALQSRHIFARGYDGLEWVIAFNNAQEPYYISTFLDNNGTSRLVEIQYSRYPFVNEIDITDTKSKRSYFINPGDLEYNVLAEYPLNALEWTSAEPQTMQIEESKFLSISSLMYLYSLNAAGEVKGIYRTYSIENSGQLIKMESDENEDGEVDYRLYFKNGAVDYALKDLDRDSFFELREDYKDGQLEKISLDLDRDKKYDYIETYTSAFKKRWLPNAEITHDLFQTMLPHTKETIVNIKEN